MEDDDEDNDRDAFFLADDSMEKRTKKRAIQMKIYFQVFILICILI